MTKPTGRPVGRPSKLSPENHDLFLKAIRAGNTVECSAQLIEVERRTVYGWLKRGRQDRAAGKANEYTRFLLAVKKALAEAEVSHTTNIARAANAGQWTASAWWLERRAHKAYSRKDHLTLASDKDRPVVFEMVIPQRPKPEAEDAAATPVAEEEVR